MRRPRVDCVETGVAYLLEADLPGVDESTLSVTLERDVLAIRGRMSLPEPGGFSLLHREFEPSDFERTFRVSQAIDQQRVEASLEGGVLRLSLPKKRPEVRRIPVSTRASGAGGAGQGG